MLGLAGGLGVVVLLCEIVFRFLQNKVENNMSDDELKTIEHERIIKILKQLKNSDDSTKLQELEKFISVLRNRALNSKTLDQPVKFGFDE